MFVNPLRATVSGSFRRGMGHVQDAVNALTDLGIEVLSPADPRVVDQYGEFLFVASDKLRSISLVQRRHLAAIENSHFLWLADPDGYVGTSASFELGYAYMAGTPIFASDVPADMTLRYFVQVVPSIQSVIPMIASRTKNSFGPHVLLDPTAAAEAAHAEIEIARGALVGIESVDEEKVRETTQVIQRLFENA